jgi:dinuclear metal center YbgI/SA1388 family protein
MHDANSKMDNRHCVADVVRFLHVLAPLELAESWDNVGLLWGGGDDPVERAMTCLTLTPEVADEAIADAARLIVSHHPILFRPLQRVASDTAQGRMLLKLAQHRIAVYSAHTAYDSTAGGINDQLAASLGLDDVTVLRPIRLQSSERSASPEMRGAGRCGRLSSPHQLGELIAHVKRRLDVSRADFAGRRDARIERVAIACGSGSDFLNDALASGCDVLITGEARFHVCLEARERGLALILIGHFASERPAMRQLAEQIRANFPGLHVWASRVESDPVQRD